jgi:hypothetical protein
MHYDEIAERTIPQVEAILGKLGKHIGLRLGVPFGSGEVVSSEPINKKGKAPKLSELAAFCGEFKGIGK